MPYIGIKLRDTGCIITVKLIGSEDQIDLVDAEALKNISYSAISVVDLYDTKNLPKRILEQIISQQRFSDVFDYTVEFIEVESITGTGFIQNSIKSIKEEIY